MKLIIAHSVYLENTVHQVKFKVTAAKYIKNAYPRNVKL